MRVLVLGAGQDVGKSCVVVRLGGKTLMFDCGMHMGYQDARRFPDFSLLGRAHDFTPLVDAVFISHFHMDHIGALPYFTEVCGYDGPVLMTHPTRAIAAVLLEDYWRLLLARPGSGPLFGKQHIEPCLAKARCIDLQETVQVCEGVEVTAYYAGHVLGAAILHVRMGSESVVYTGDFNTVPERALAGASVPRLRPGLLISESTYATTVRGSKRSREAGVLAMVSEALAKGGKVLIPVFAVGRAQELLLMLDDHWERTQSQVPIYFSGAMAERASQYYRLLLNWASERVKRGGLGARAAAFGFKRVLPWQPSLLDQPGPCVLFATPGMLHSGTSLEVFKAWAPDARNLVLLPSFQVGGTLGRQLLAPRSGSKLEVTVDKTKVQVNCKVHYAPFSAHADAKGILQLVQQVSPEAVMLVHGEVAPMRFMCDRLQNTLGIPAFMPETGQEVAIVSTRPVSVPTSQQLLRRLPLTLAQLQARTVGGGGSSSSVGDAAAGWLQQGDLHQLVAAAMDLAGLGPPKPGAAPQQQQEEGQQQGRQQQEEGQQDGQQQGQEGGQQPGATAAAARAAQLAPWIELLAAAAQQANSADPEQREQQQAQQQQQQHSQEQEEKQQQQQHAPLLDEPGQHLPQTVAQQPAAQAAPQQLAASASAAAGAAAGEPDEPPQPSVAQLSQLLRRQLALEEAGTVLDGVLLVRHSQPAPAGPHAGANGHSLHGQQPPPVASMQLVPAEEAAAALGMQQHTLRLRCQLPLPPSCWRGCGDEPGAAAAAAVAGVLQPRLPPDLAADLQVDEDGGCVRLRSLALTPVGDAAHGRLECAWLICDDAAAQQCLGQLKLALAAAGVGGAAAP